VRPGAGQEDVHKLPVCSANEIAGMRVEACDDICHHYIKTMDMTKDGNAVPVVDEITTIALNVWPRNTAIQRFKRICWATRKLCV